jgi:heme-degrading monooxygenase HmoA
MYVRSTRVQSPPERLDDMVNAFISTALPAIRALPGYAGSSLGVDRQTGDGQAATFWDSAEALANSETAATGIRTDTTQAAGGTVVSVQRGEVVLLERAAQPSVPAFIRVVRAQGDPAKLDAMVQATREKALPILRGLRGFRALVVSVDRDSGLSVVTSVWDTAADREASDAAIDEVRRGVFATAGATQPPDVSRYEVMSVEFVGVGAASR